MSYYKMSYKTKSSNDSTTIVIFMMIMVVMCCISSVLGGGAWLLFFTPQEGDSCKGNDKNAEFEIDEDGKCTFVACDSGYQVDVATRKCVLSTGDDDRYGGATTPSTTTPSTTTPSTTTPSTTTPSTTTPAPVEAYPAPAQVVVPTQSTPAAPAPSPCTGDPPTLPVPHDQLILCARPDAEGMTHSALCSNGKFRFINSDQNAFDMGIYADKYMDNILMVDCYLYPRGDDI
jgi:hypothetical protein